MVDQIHIYYEVTCARGSHIEQISHAIALEQTVEVPDDCIHSDFVREHIVGQVLEISPLEKKDNTYLVVIGYAPDITAYQIPQFLNLFFGNISLKNYIRIVNVTLPECFLEQFSGPNYGISGIRKILGVYDRPLAATALKPMGSTPETLANMAEAFALGGGDIIKDDHGLTDHSFCPFEKRVRLCQEAIQRVNLKTGRQTLYFPNVLGSAEQLGKQVEFAVKQGVRGVLISPFLVGPDILRHLSAQHKILFMAHPAFTGTHFHDPQHGIIPAVLLGTLFRLLGADISVYPNSGGRFGFSVDECLGISEALQKPLGKMKPAFPGPAGGMQLNSIEIMAKQYGVEAIYIIGGALLQHSRDLQQSTRIFMQKIRSLFKERLTTPVYEMISAGDWGGGSAGQDRRSHLAWQSDFTWTGRAAEAYKAESGLAFAKIRRQELIGKHGEKTGFDLRYFQIEPQGFSSLEKHRHEHVIIAVRGQGVLQLGKRQILLKPHDIAYVEPDLVHQIRNESAEPFGFFCIVDHERDKPIAP
ncbi:cupin domain-containing protein [bacterium]|nr:cupin domain-containing protein [bacterium]